MILESFLERTAGLTVLLFACALVGTAGADESRVFEVTAAQQLALTQLDQLIEAEESAAAADLAMRIIDEASDRLVAVDVNSSLLAQHFLPVQLIVHDRLLRSRAAHPQVLTLFRERYDRIAGEHLQAATASRSLTQLRQVLRRYFATSHGDDALLAMADIALQTGQPRVAIAALRRMDPRWQPHADGSSDQQSVAATDWPSLLMRVDVDDESSLMALAEQVAVRPGLPLGCYLGSDIAAADVALRLVFAFRLAGDAETADKLTVVAKKWFAQQPASIAGRQGTTAEMLDWLHQHAQSWPQPSTDTYSQTAMSAPLALQSAAPTWTQPLPSLPNLPRDLAPFWSLRSGAYQNVQTLPVIRGQQIFLHTGRGIVARSLEDGTPWPPGIGEEEIFSAADAGKPLWPAARPLGALPRYSLASEGRWLAGRFGSLTSIEPDAIDRQAPSHIVVLDLQREAALQSGYPVAPPLNSHFAGPPILVDSQLLVAVRHTDQATETTRILCLDIPSAGTLWISSPIAVERRVRDVARAGDVPLVAGADMVICQVGGVTASLDRASGQFKWLVQQPLAELSDSAYPRQRAAAHKSHAALGLIGDQLIVGAVDVDRLVSLDAADGRLQWATAAGIADDVDQVIGSTSRHIVAAGRQLYWLDRSSGHMAATFPGGVTPQPGAASEQPVTAGRAVMTSEHVYWPTAADAILVFDAELAATSSRAATARMVGRLPLEPYGIQGGDLAAAPGVLIHVGTTFLSGYASAADSSP